MTACLSNPCHCIEANCSAGTRAGSQGGSQSGRGEDQVRHGWLCPSVVSLSILAPHKFRPNLSRLQQTAKYRSHHSATHTLPCLLSPPRPCTLPLTLRTCLLTTADTLKLLNMSESSYDVDSDGDLLLILSIPREPFALWEIPEAPGPSLPTGPPVVETPGVFDVPMDESTPHGVKDISRQLQLKVSSKHLMMASPRFKKMLSGDWVEAKTIHPDGYRHVEFEGFDPEGTKIVLNILHGKTRRVPRIVDLELLAKIAVVVDDLECYEEVEVFSDMWIAGSRATVPIEYDRDLILWILVSSVFRKPDLFKSTTRTAILWSPGPVQTLGLPIRQSVVGGSIVVSVYSVMYTELKLN